MRTPDSRYDRAGPCYMWSKTWNLGFEKLHRVWLGGSAADFEGTCTL